MKEFTVWCPEDGEESHNDGRAFLAVDAEHAAALWAERRDCDGDYGIVRNEASIETMVWDGDRDQKFIASGEMVRHYRARKA